MTRTLCLLFSLVLLLGVTPLAAQEQEDVYVVMPGDGAWRVADNMWDNPRLWREVVEKNPFLKEKGRITVNPKNGWTYVMMHPGEQLFGLQALGIIAPKPTPLSELGIKTPDPVVVREIPQWTWWILGIALMFLVLCWLLYRMLTRDPATSRPAMVPGGVTEANATVAIQQVAARAFGYNQGQSVNQQTYQWFTVIQQTAGRIWGNMTVRYADGRSVPRRLNGERAYRAQVRLQDGGIETLYMLQACGNDLRMGGISRYLPGPEFRFEADPVVAPVVAPAPAPQPDPEPAPAVQTAPDPQPTAEPETIPPAPAAEVVTPQPVKPAWDPGVVKFELRKATDGQQALARLSGVDETDNATVEIEPGVVTLRFRPKQ